MGRFLARAAAIALLAGPILACDDAVTDPELPAGTTLTAVSAGDAHACALDAEGAAYCWGGNTHGQLGADVGRLSSVPVRVRDVPPLVRVSAGGMHTCGLTAEGAAWCWGANAYGQLGRGSAGGSSEPERAGDGVYVDLDAGFAHTCAVRSDRVAECWGHNAFGQLGTGAYEDRSEPTPIAGGVQAIQVAAGHTHTCAVSVTGAVYCWGGNERAQLGIGHRIKTPVPAQVGGPEATFIAVSVGFEFSCALTFEGAALCWGDNRFGQLGSDGVVLAGSARPVDSERRFEQIDAGPGRAVCAVAPGSLLCWGDPPGDAAVTHTPRRPFPDTLSLTGVSVGGDFACGLAAGGEARCWGVGWSGQLGNGRLQKTVDPVPVRTR